MAVAAAPVEHCGRVRGRLGEARANARAVYAARTEAISKKSVYVIRVRFADGDEQDFFIRVPSLFTVGLFSFLSASLVECLARFV